MQPKPASRTPLRLGRRFFLALLAVGWVSAGAAQPPLFATPGLGVAVMQSGMAQPIADFGAHYEVTLLPEPFAMSVRPEIVGDGVMLAIGLTPAVFERFGSSGDPLFGPASAYAREAKPGPLYLTDPACQGAGTTGFNILWAEMAQNGAWPVTSIMPDRASAGCAAPGLDPTEDLIRPGQVLYLVFSDGEGADFLMLVFEEARAS